MNPLLQDFGFVIHPPILYIGYVGQSIIFALVLAHYMSNALNKASAFRIRRYALVAWSFLTLGITLGSWWAYRELGWGGWWFWDPVENASLLPWFSATVFIHLLNGYIRQGHYKHAFVIFSILGFLLSLLATFLVRSGLLTSVHAFVSDPNRGMHLLIIIAIAGILSAWVFTRYYKPSPSAKLHVQSNAFYIMLQALLVSGLLLCVALGTFYPLVIEILGFESISVGANYFNTVLLPFVIPILCVMGWFHSRQYPKTVLAIISLLASWLTLYLFFKHVMVMPLLGLSLGYWVILSALKQMISAFRRHSLSMQMAMLLAHIGVGLLSIGVSIVSYYSLEKHIKVTQGETIEIGPYQILYQDAITEDMPNYQSKAVQFDINGQGPLLSEKRFYTTSKMVMTDAGVLTIGLSDIYIALGEQLSSKAWSMRVQYKPWIRLIWLSGILMSLAGLIWSFRRDED